ILELAVRGKLLPQDSNDEPASGLLDQIIEERVRLVKEKAIKRASFIFGLHFLKNHRSILQFNRPETKVALMQPHT
ncbi:MAG: hypothetical protein U9Q61_05950, partial [Thermodesulfobacteriota bacterium]|nr:hypothetical protein [Thermodesulfobacteriota bacterium]